MLEIKTSLAHIGFLLNMCSRCDGTTCSYNICGHVPISLPNKKLPKNKKCKKKIIYIHIHIPPPQRSLVQFSQIQETPPPPNSRFERVRRKKHRGPGVDIFFHKNPPFATCDLESGSHLCCWYLQFYDGSFTRSGDPPGSFTGWKPMVRNESDWRFFRMLRMCWTLSHVFFFGP